MQEPDTLTVRDGFTWAERGLAAGGVTARWFDAVFGRSRNLAAASATVNTAFWDTDTDADALDADRDAARALGVPDPTTTEELRVCTAAGSSSGGNCVGTDQGVYELVFGVVLVHRMNPCPLSLVLDRSVFSSMVCFSPLEASSGIHYNTHISPSVS